MSEEKITVESEKVTINDYEITDEDVVKYFEALSQDGKNLQEGLDKLLKLGALATKATTAGLTTEYIDKEMSKLQIQLFEQIQNQFGENGAIPQFLAENLGIDGKIAKEVLNPNVTGSPINILGNGILSEIEKIKNKLNIQEEKQKGTQKGFDFEDYCEPILEEIAKVHGDTVDKTGDDKGEIDDKGDFVWTVTDLDKKIVIEMKDVQSLTLPYIKDQLNGGMANRVAEYGILVSKQKSALPKQVGFFNEYDNNKLVIALGVELEDEPLHDDLLRVAIGWARTKLKQSSGGAVAIDIAKIKTKIQNVDEKLGALTVIKRKCTSIENTSQEIQDVADDIKQEISSSLEEITDLIKEESSSSQ
jgi:hypothetical protein